MLYFLKQPGIGNKQAFQPKTKGYDHKANLEFNSIGLYRSICAAEILQNAFGGEGEHAF